MSTTPFVSRGTRREKLRKATKRPSAESEGSELFRMPCAPVELTLTRVVVDPNTSGPLGALPALGRTADCPSAGPSVPVRIAMHALARSNLFIVMVLFLESSVGYRATPPQVTPPEEPRSGSPLRSPAAAAPDATSGCQR